MGRGISLRRLIVGRACSVAIVVMYAISFVLIGPNSSLARSRPAPFSHAATGFPLIGNHASVPCASCHIAGRFKSVPRDCFGCHNGQVAPGKPPTHIRTTERCGQCHQSTQWNNIRSVDHTEILSAPCTSCHNGTTSLGKPASHLPTIAPCQMCHKSTASFAIGTKMDHTGIAVGCATCHNGTEALGKPGNHLPTNLSCETCHFSTTRFAGAFYKHQAGDTNCSTCHNNAIATGATTPPHVPVGAVQCGNCHTNTATSFVNYTMRHAAVSGSRCDSCHNGAYTDQGTKGAQGAASFAGHVATAGRDCAACHAGAAASFASWSGGTYAHQASDINCSVCHNGTTAKGITTPPHIPTGVIQCSNCHTNTATSFVTYTMNHTAVNGSRCDSCHNGSYAAEGTKGAQGTASFSGHLPTNGQDCLACHAKAANGYTSWAGAKYVHAANDTNCSSCHNGTTAAGKTTPPHVPVGTVQCSNCHTNTATSFVTYTMNHSAVNGSRCDSCHSGSYTAEGTKGALGTASYSGHVATNGQDCLACHASAATSYTSWAGAKYVHAAGDTNCSSCHNGTAATGKTTPPHIPVGTAQCSNCHTNTATSFVTYTMSHAAVSGSRCDSCHNGSYLTEGTKGALSTASYPGHVATAGHDCATCHAGAAVSFASWKGGTYVHQASDANCVNCHAGRTATGMSTPPHIPTSSTQCSNCHTNTAASFTTYTMNHAAVTGILCQSCHNGSYAAEGTKGALGTASYPGHVPTNGWDCTSCHANAAAGYTSWAGANYVHAASDSNCSNCHNGKTATGNTTPPHIPVGTVQCSNCHTKTAASFVTYTMSHAAVSGSRCDSCHSGSYAAEGTKGALGTASYPNHVATNGQDCTACHAKAANGYTSWAGAKYVHAANDTNCSSCHNGTTAAGKTTPPHVPVGTVQCSNCHTNTATSFVTYTMNHSAVNGSRCDSCHSGSYTAEGTKGALGTASYPVTWRRTVRIVLPATPVRRRATRAGPAQNMFTRRAIPIAPAATMGRPPRGKRRRPTFRSARPSAATATPIRQRASSPIR